MIIPALYEYYKNKKNMPPFGFTAERISFLIVLLDNNNWYISDCRIQDNNKLISSKKIVPSLGKSRSSGIVPNFLWDSAKYIFGIDEKRGSACLEKSIELHNDLLSKTNDVILHRVLTFLHNENNLNFIINREDYEDISTSNIAFAYENDDDSLELMTERNDVKKIWADYRCKDSNYKTQCLVTGENTSVALLHPSIKGVRGGNSTGTAMVSFNQESFIHHGKSQNINAPISIEVAHGYTTALNHLLNPINKRRIISGDDTIVFWSSIPSDFEDIFSKMNSKLDDEADVHQVRVFLENVCKGNIPNNIDTDINFNILVLTANSARLVVRSFYTNTVGDIIENIKQHYLDLNIVGLDYKPQIWQLLLATLRSGAKIKDLKNTQLPSQILKSTLIKQRYPYQLVDSILKRIRIEGNVSPIRAAILKAYLIRYNKFNKKEVYIKVGLNDEYKNTAYLLGRALAIIGRAQYISNPNSNTNIAQSLFGFAAATPNAAFKRLLPQMQYYLKKSSKNIWAEKLLSNILKDVKEIPRMLTSKEQVKFMLGYYHQKQEFFNKQEINENESN